VGIVAVGVWQQVLVQGRRTEAFGERSAGQHFLNWLPTQRCFRAHLVERGAEIVLVLVVASRGLQFQILVQRDISFSECSVNLTAPFHVWYRAVPANLVTRGQRVGRGLNQLLLAGRGAEGETERTIRQLHQFLGEVDVSFLGSRGRGVFHAGQQGAV